MRFGDASAGIRGEAFLWRVLPSETERDERLAANRFLVEWPIPVPLPPGIKELTEFGCDIAVMGQHRVDTGQCGSRTRIAGRPTAGYDHPRSTRIILTTGF